MSMQKSTKSSIERCGGDPSTLAAHVGGEGEVRKFPSIVAVAAACGLAMSVSAPAATDYSDTPVFGGSGGGSFLAYCPKNTYLIGIGGRTGNWIDAIQPICAQWNSTTQAFNPPVTGRTTGGSGGGPATLMCPAGMVVRGWEIARIAARNALVVQYVRPQCETFSPEQRASAQIPGRFGGDGATNPANLMGYKCPQGQFANGIYGASGAYVDNAGLKCEVPPFILGRPTPAEPVKSIGRVPSASGPAGPARSICEAARDARARNSPAAPNLEAQCRAAGERPPSSTTIPAVQPPLAVGSGPAQTPPRPKGVTYNSPMIVAANGQTVMLDFCREYGSACGKPAADAFCRQKGHPDASRFQISEDIGHTAIISTGAICDDPSCDGFTKIQCNPDPE